MAGNALVIKGVLLRRRACVSFLMRILSSSITSQHIIKLLTFSDAAADTQRKYLVRQTVCIHVPGSPAAVQQVCFCSRAVKARSPRSL